MAGPWEQYGPAGAAGPWEQYAAPANLDRRTGAPASVRAATGAAQTAADRLATIRRFYPDAQPHGADNFIFTRNGRPTLYNPPGLDFGDVASVTPEIGEFVGGAAGAAATAVGAPTTGGASLLAMPAAVGLGAAGGREIATLGASMLGNTVDTRGPFQRVGDAAGTAAMNAVALPVADLLSRGARAGMGAVSRLMGPRSGPAAIQDFANTGVTPSAGAVTGNRGTQLMEATLEATPGGAAPMAAMRERQASEMGQAVERTAQQFGTPMDPSRVGGAVREGADAAARRFEERQGQLYDRAYSLIPSGTRVPMPTVEGVGRAALAELRQAPESRSGVLQPVLDRVEALLADAGQSGMSFDAVRAVRTDLGRLLGEPRGSAQAPSSATRVYLERLYGALSDDMYSAISNPAYPWRERALRLADRYTRFNQTQNLDAVRGILDRGTDEQVFRLVFPQNGRPDPQALARIRRNLTPDEWGAVQATVLDRMGLPTAGVNAGETFSVNTFLTNWNRLNANGGAARQALFGGGQSAPLAGELDNLVRVAQRLRDAERMRNFSGTARVAGMGAGALAAGQDVVEGDWKGLATLAALGVVAPRYAAQMMTDPGVVRWLAGATRIAAMRGGIPDSQWGRLVAVAEANPELRDAVEAYRLAFTEAAPAAMPRASTTAR